MSIQSSINSTLSSIYQMRAINEGLKTMSKQTQLQAGWFGEKESGITGGQTFEGIQQTAENERKQFQYEKSGQAEADAEAMALYEEQAAKKAADAAINYTRDARIEAKRAQKEKFKERKARVLNRHGVIYKEVL